MRLFATKVCIVCAYCIIFQARLRIIQTRFYFAILTLSATGLSWISWYCEHISIPYLFRKTERDLDIALNDDTISMWFYLLFFFATIYTAKSNNNDVRKKHEVIFYYKIFFFIMVLLSWRCTLDGGVRRGKELELETIVCWFFEFIEIFQ